MNLEFLDRRSHLKEASRRLVSPVKNVVEEATGKLRDGVTDNFGRRHVVLFNENTNRIYLLSRTPEVQSLDRSCGLFVDAIQLDDKKMPQKSLFQIQLPSDSNFVTQSSLYLLRGMLPKEMLKLAKEIGVAKIVELDIYASYLSLLRKTYERQA